MSIETGTDDLKVTQEPEATLAVGSAIKLIHTITVAEKTASELPIVNGRFDMSKQTFKTTETVMQGFIYTATPTIQTKPVPRQGENGYDLIKTPAVIYHIGELMVESINGEPVFAERPPRIIYSTDPAYTIEALPNVINIP